MFKHKYRLLLLLTAGISYLSLANPAFAELRSEAGSGPITLQEILGQAPAAAPVSDLREQPTIRVLLAKTNDTVSVTTTAGYVLYSGTTFQATVAPNEKVTLRYTAGTYFYTIGDAPEVRVRDMLRLVPAEPTATFTITSLKRIVSGRSKINFNTYRGTVEFHYSEKAKQSYLINELPLEQYVAGVTETADSAPTEYLKALQTAARSYANALIVPVSKNHLFDVYATTADQLYLGYNAEETMPNVVAATNATAGELVTYNGKPVITYYFSHSNGKTLSAHGTTRPWLKSVAAPYDNGLKKAGHGIGMSLHDAMARAAKDDWTYDQLLGYYYTSTTIAKIY